MAAMSAHAADVNDERYFQLTKEKITDVTEQYRSELQTMAQAGLREECDTEAAHSPMAGESGLNPLDQAELIIDQIVNIGKKLWDLVAKGTPVVNVKSYTANALPKGLQCWSDLSSWQVPQSKVYRVQYENGFGMTVVDFAYRLTYTAGGTANGKGKYITNATVMPAFVDVQWGGFTLNANVEVPSVFNTGTKEDPVAGMQMVVKWSVGSIISNVQQSETYYISGDNSMKELE